jgi:hypothetical protein
VTAATSGEDVQADDHRSPVGRFGPTLPDHPVGKPCVICGEPILAGQVPSLISLAPADAEEAQKQQAGRAYNAVAGIAHESCAWPSVCSGGDAR